MDKKKTQKTSSLRKQQQFIDLLARMIARKHVMSEWTKADAKSSKPIDKKGLREKG